MWYNQQLLHPAGMLQPEGVEMPGKKLYLDQCMVSNLANQGMPWNETRGGQALVAATQRGAVEVWASPMHVLETFLCADFTDQQQLIDTTKLDLRQSIASTLLHLAEAKRMSQSYEFILVEDFMVMVEDLAPGTVRTWAPFERLRKEHQQIFLGLLGLLAAYRNLDRPDAVSDMVRVKVTTRLLHSRFARSPRDYMNDVIEAAREYRVTREDIFAEFDRRPLSDLIREIEENEAQVTRLDGGTIQRLQREREFVAKSYGAAEIGECLQAVFSDQLFLLLTFNIAQVRDQWAQIVGCPEATPPVFLAGADDAACESDLELIVHTLELLLRAVARERLLLPGLIYKLVLGELELALRKGEIPSGGLGFDSEHAAMLTRVDAFATVDGNFATLARRAAAELAKDGQHVKIIEGMDELVRYLD